MIITFHGNYFTRSGIMTSGMEQVRSFKMKGLDVERLQGRTIGRMVTST
jgi:hypothetical protein